MLLEKDIKKILGHVAEKEPIQIALDGSDILLSFVDNGSKLSLATVVYSGGNYIPASVRSCVSNKSVHFGSPLKTSLSINEPQFQINLRYLGSADALTSGELKETLEQFGVLAEKWRLFLEENDRNDLIYIRAK